MNFHIVLLSSSLLTDRILLYSSFLTELTNEAQVRIWALSARHSRFRDAWKETPAIVEGFPRVFPFKEFPYNYPLRRLNELVWDFRLRPPSRLSMMRHLKNRQWPWYYRILKGPARLLAWLRAERGLENWVERILLSHPRSSEAQLRLQSNPPDIVVSMRPHFYEDPAVVAEAKRLGISVLAFITSWDNLSTKNRMLFRYDAFLVWSERMKEELHYFYPYSRSVPVYVVGAPQFDVFFQNRFRMSRDEFCAQQSLQGSLPIVVYALGSPNFLPGEWYAAYYLAKKVAEGELGNAQLIVRPHPLFDSEDLHQKFRAFGPRVVVQRTGQTDLPSNARFQNEEQIREWVNTFRHADVVVNFASTATIDAAILDKPVVNLDFDPEPAQTRQSLVKDVNHAWTHFRPIADSGGIWLVNSLDEMLEAVSTYLRHPELHCEKRQWIARYVAGYLDGLCGERMARAVLDFARSNLKKRFKKTHSIS